MPKMIEFKLLSREKGKMLYSSPWGNCLFACPILMSMTRTHIQVTVSFDVAVHGQPVSDTPGLRALLGGQSARVSNGQPSES